MSNSNSRGRGRGRGRGRFDTSRYKAAGGRTSNTAIKTAGEKGAEAHTVSEDSRIRLTQMLIALRDSSNEEDKLEFKSELSNTERKFMHELSKQLGLVSKSLGKGEDRRITVSKVAETKKIARGADGGEECFPTLRIGTRGIHELRNYVTAYPPNDIDRMESYETGSSLLHALTKHKQKEKERNDEILWKMPGDDDDCNTISNSKQQSNDLMNTLELFNATKETTNIIEDESPSIRVDLKQRKHWYKTAQQARHRHPKNLSMSAQRRALPAFNYASQICSAIRSNAVVIISGDTGCGKTTQVPQFILDDPEMGPTCNMIITQPRRISAVSVAERVASERCEGIGQSIGYNVRLDSCCSPRSQCVFVTPGVLLRKLQSNPALIGYTHIILDEVHERDRHSEFLMICLKDLLSTVSTHLKVVLMSATLQTDELVEYWRGAGIGADLNIAHSGHYNALPPEVNIPGRTYPVQEFFLEDILSITGFVDDDGALRNGDLSQLEKDLTRMLQKKQSKQDDRKHPLSATSSPTLANTTRTTLTCCMCNHSGFLCPEELGTHVATCMGDPGTTLMQLESKLRSLGVNDSSTYDNDLTATLIVEGNDGEGDDDNGERPSSQCESDEDDELTPTLWDGTLPFGEVGGVKHTSTLTEEEMLKRYHTTHDDENIDDELIMALCRYIVQSSYGDGAILIFFPGWMEISEFSMLLESTAPFINASKFWILPLHSGIASQDQRLIFKRPPRGVRKIILATNIAETSVTIDDVAFVVDTGRAKEKSYDPHIKTSTLQPVWISQASAIQRKGRAGRTKPGVCFHLFSRRRYASFRPFRESELLRTPLEEMCLQCKQLGLAPGGTDDPDGIPAFLSKALTPPHPKSISNALELLVELGAMETKTNNLTDLGKCLSVLSLEPRVGKMVIWAHLLGCAKLGIAMGVAMSYKSPFALPPPHLRKNAEQVKIELSKNSESDQITVLNVLHSRDHFMSQRTMGAFHSFCKSRFISPTVLNMIADLRKNTSRELKSLGFPPCHIAGYHNRHVEYQDQNAFLQASIVAGLYPNLAHRSRGDLNFSTMTNKKAKVHISSVNAIKGQRLQGKCTSPEGDVEFIVFGELVKGTNSFTMNQTTHLTSPLPLILLCGEVRVRPLHTDFISCNQPKLSLLSIDDWLMFQCHTEVATSLVILRKRLENVFLDLVMNPRERLSLLKPAEKDALEALSAVLESSYEAYRNNSNQTVG